MDIEDPEKVLKIVDKVKHASFGKVKLYSKNKDQKRLEELQYKKVKTNKETMAHKSLVIESIDEEITGILKKI